VWTSIIVTVDYSVPTAVTVSVWGNGILLTNEVDMGSKSFPTGTSHILGVDCPGYMDEFRIYSKKLSTDEITNIADLKMADGYRSTLLGLPNIQLLDDFDPLTHSADGDIIINDEKLLRIDPFNGVRSETFLVDIDVIFDTYTAIAPTIIKQILAEMDKVFDTESLAHTTYYYKPRYDWNGSYRLGVVKFQVEVLNALVVRPGLT